LLFIDTEQFLLWLEHNTKPWIKVVQLWEKTSKLRLKSLQSGTQSIQNYIKLYPVLEEPQGYTNKNLFVLLEGEFLPVDISFNVLNISYFQLLFQF